MNLAGVGDREPAPLASVVLIEAKHDDYGKKDYVTMYFVQEDL